MVEVAQAHGEYNELVFHEHGEVVAVGTWNQDKTSLFVTFTDDQPAQFFGSEQAALDFLA